jgi:hypothetical protein
MHAKHLSGTTTECACGGRADSTAGRRRPCRWWSPQLRGGERRGPAPPRSACAGAGSSLLAASTLKSEELLNCSFQQAGYMLLCSRSVPSNATERTNKPLPPSLMQRESGPPKECCCLLITSTEACMHGSCFHFFSKKNLSHTSFMSWPSSVLPPSLFVGKKKTVIPLTDTHF